MPLVVKCVKRAVAFSSSENQLLFDAVQSFNYAAREINSKVKLFCQITIYRVEAITMMEIELLIQLIQCSLLLRFGRQFAV